MHFSLIKVSDLILCDEDGNIVEGDEVVNGAAFAIHSEIHKARPDVTAACHAHSVHGKAFSAFGRELDMITQDALRFYKSHGVYRDFRGVVVDSEEGKRIAAALGDGKAAILQNHGLLTVGQSVDEAAFWFISLDKTCHAQLLADAASAAGYEKKIIDDDEAAYTALQVGGPEKGWLAFQPCMFEPRCQPCPYVLTLPQITTSSSRRLRVISSTNSVILEILSKPIDVVRQGMLTEMLL